MMFSFRNNTFESIIYNSYVSVIIKDTLNLREYLSRGVNLASYP